MLLQVLSTLESGGECKDVDILLWWWIVRQHCIIWATWINRNVVVFGPPSGHPAVSPHEFCWVLATALKHLLVCIKDASTIFNLKFIHRDVHWYK